MKFFTGEQEIRRTLVRTDRFIVVRAFSHPHEAELACSALRASGIEATIADAHIVTANWLYSNLVGGVKVLVPADDADAAREILDSTAVVHTTDQPELDDEALVDLPLFPVKRRMQCKDCGHVLARPT